MLCPVEDDFPEESPIAELPHSSWSLSPPTTKPQSTGSKSPPIREEPCSPPPITELLTSSQSHPIARHQATGSGSPPIREEPCSKVSEVQPIKEEPSTQVSESPPIREEPSSTVSEAQPIRDKEITSSSEPPPITDHNSTTGSDMQSIMEQESKAGSEIPPITEEETTTESEFQPITDQQSNFRSESPPITNQSSQSKLSPSPNTMEHPASPSDNSLQTIEDHSPSSSDKPNTTEDSSRSHSPILEEEEDKDPETEHLRYVTVSKRRHEDTPLPGRRLSSRVAQALAEETSVPATQVEKVHQTLEQKQGQTTKGGNRKSSRNTSKAKKEPQREQDGLELVTEETGQEKEDGNTEKTSNQSKTGAQDICSSDNTETLDKESLAPDVAMGTSSSNLAMVTSDADVAMATSDADVAEETSSMSQGEPIGDLPEIVFKDAAVESPRKANFSDTTKGDEDVVIMKVVQEEEEEAEPRRPRRFRRPATKPMPQTSSAVKLRKGRGRKQEEDIEVIYRNKNYRPPEQKTIETIYEDPIVRKKTGEEQLVGRPMKRRVSFRNFYYPKKMNKKKASKNVKRFHRKSLEGVTVDEKLINLDRQMIGISPAKFCLPGDQMLFQFASEEASSDLVTVKEEPLELINEETHQDLDLSGVGPLDEEDTKQELFENQDKVVYSQEDLLKEQTEQPTDADSTTSITGRSGRKRRRSFTSQVKVKTEVVEEEESESQIASESDDQMTSKSKPKKSRRRSSVKQDNSVSLSTDVSTEVSTNDVEASTLTEHVSLSSSESATASEQDGEATQGRKKRGRRKSIKMNKPGDIGHRSDGQSSDMDSVDLVIDAVIGGKSLDEPADQITQHVTSRSEEGNSQAQVKTSKQRSRRRSLLLTQKSSSLEDDNERNTEASNGEEGKDASSQETVRAKKKTSRRKSVLPPTLEETASTTEDQNSTEEESSSHSVLETLKKKGRRRSTASTAKKDAAEDFSQESCLTEEQALEDGYSTESSVTNVVVRRRSRRKSVLLQQSNSEDNSLAIHQEGMETNQQSLEEGYSTESSVTDVVVRRRSRRKSVLLQQSSTEDCSLSIQQQGMETNQQTLEEGYSTESSVTDVVVRRRSRRKSVLLQQSSTEDCSLSIQQQGMETDQQTLEEGYSTESSVTDVVVRRSRRKSVLVQQSSSEDCSQPMKEQGTETDQSEEMSATTSAVKRRSRRKSVLLQQSSSEDCSQPIKEQGTETDQSEEMSATTSVVKRRSRRKSVLLQQSSSEDCSQTMKEQGTETDQPDETSATASVAKRRPRRRSLAIQREGSSSEESVEPAQWSGSEMSCDVPPPENKSVKTRKSRPQDIIPDSTTCENAEPAMSESGESQDSNVSATTRKTRRQSVLLKASSENEEEVHVQLSEKVSAVDKKTKQQAESLGDASGASTVHDEVPTSMSVDRQTGEIREERKEHQSNSDINLPFCSSQESVSSQSVDGFAGLTEDEPSCVSRRKRKRRKSVLLKQFTWAGESPPQKSTITEKFQTKEQDKKEQTQETLPSHPQQTSEDLENVLDSQESDDVVTFNFSVSQKEMKEGELEEIQSDAETGVLPAKKAKKSLSCNEEEKNLTSNDQVSFKPLTDSQPQVSTKKAGKKSVCKKAENEERIIPQDLRKNDEFEGSHLQEVQSDLQTGTQSVRRQKRNREPPVLSNQSSKEMPENDLEDKTETPVIPVCTKGDQAFPVPTEIPEDILTEDIASKKQPTRRGRRQLAHCNQRRSQKTTSSEDKAQDFPAPNNEEVSKTAEAAPIELLDLSEEDFVTKEETYMDNKQSEVTIDEPKRKVRRQSARFRRTTPVKMASPKTVKMASPKTSPVKDNAMMFEEDFVTNDDTFIDNKEIESLINSIAEGNTPVGSPCKSVSPKVVDVNLEKDVKKKPIPKKAKTTKNVGKRGATRGKKKAELPKNPKVSSPQNSQPSSSISPKLNVAESDKTVKKGSSPKAAEYGLQDVCSVKKEKKVKKGGKSLSPTTNGPTTPHEKASAMLSPKSRNSLKKMPASKTPSAALQSPSSKGRSSKKKSTVDTNTSLSQFQKHTAVVKPPPQSPESVLSPKSRDQGRKITSLFSNLSTSSDANQSFLGAMPSFKSLVKDVVSPDTTVNSRQPAFEASKASTQTSTSHASKTNSFQHGTGSKSAGSTPFSDSGKPGHSDNQTPKTSACGTDMANTFSCPGNSSVNDSASNSAKSKSFAFAKTYSVKQHWAKRFVNTRDTYLNKFKMFAFGSPSSQSSAEEND
ncbi:streptococcal hemagglutinin-like [Branchiostoma lanceolatum]|uniref:streptococcal hemagglutinin-like n=1 Tax=Branchiostoma lanceolatum TaxID=7740 RepID=UPI00345329A7